MDRVGVRAIIDYNGQFLLVRNAVDDAFWCLPGGGVKRGEDILTALRREIIEELGIEPVIGNLVFVHSLKGSEGYGAPAFFFHVTNGKDFLNVDLQQTSHGELEIAEYGFKHVDETNVLPRFLQTELIELESKGFSSAARIRLTDFDVK